MRNSLKLFLVCLTLIMSHTISFAIHDDDKKGKDVPIVVTDKTTDHQRSLTPEIKVYYFPL